MTVLFFYPFSLLLIINSANKLPQVGRKKSLYVDMKSVPRWVDDEIQKNLYRCIFPGPSSGWRPVKTYLNTTVAFSFLVLGRGGGGVRRDVGPGSSFSKWLPDGRCNSLARLPPSSSYIWVDFIYCRQSLERKPTAILACIIYCT